MEDKLKLGIQFDSVSLLRFSLEQTLTPRKKYEPRVIFIVSGERGHRAPYHPWGPLFGLGEHIIHSRPISLARILYKPEDLFRPTGHFGSIHKHLLREL